MKKHQLLSLPRFFLPNANNLCLSAFLESQQHKLVVFSSGNKTENISKYQSHHDQRKYISILFNNQNLHTIEKLLNSSILTLIKLYRFFISLYCPWYFLMMMMDDGTCIINW